MEHSYSTADRLARQRYYAALAEVGVDSTFFDFPGLAESIGAAWGITAPAAALAHPPAGAPAEDAHPRTGNYGGKAYMGDRVKVDWARVRLPDVALTWRGLAYWLGPMVERGRSWHGWYDRSALVLEVGIVAWCTDRQFSEREGVLVDLSGRAVDLLGERLLPFLRWALSVGGRITRGDWAMDDRDGFLTYDRLSGCTAGDAYVSTWHDVEWRSSRKGRGQPWGQTLYLGDRSSDACMRIYDKAAQQGEAGPWWRVELELKGDYAHQLMLRYLERGSSAVVEQVNRRVRFVEPQAGDSNRRRVAVCSWWLSFIQSVERGVSLRVGAKVQATVDHFREWVEHQAGPALAAIITADGGSVEWLMGVLDRGRGRWGAHHKAALVTVGAWG